MEHSIRAENNVTIIELEGEIDVRCAPQLKKLIQQLIDDGDVQILVDLSGVPFMDSTGLGIFVNAFKQLQRTGGGVKFTNPQDVLRKVFSITQTDKVFSIFESVGEAMESYR